MNDFSESGAAVRFVTAWCVDLEGKRNFDARRVEIVTCAAVGAEITRTHGWSGHDMAFG